MIRSASPIACSTSSVEAKHVSTPDERLLELAQAVDVAVVDGDVGAHADGDARRVGADDAAADDHDLRGGHAGDAAEQDAAAAGVLVQRVRAGLRGQLARHLAHRGQQREPTTRVGDRLVRDRGRARVDQALGELRVRREVQVGEQRLVGAQARDLDRLRLLDLDHQVGLGEHRVGVGDDRRALGDEVGVRDRRTGTGARLHEHGMPAPGQLAHARRGQPDAVLIDFDLCGHADDSHCGSVRAIASVTQDVKRRNLWFRSCPETSTTRSSRRSSGTVARPSRRSRRRSG